MKNSSGGAEIFNPEQPLAGRVTLVTGASRGIGYQACLSLARAGSHIIATARTQGGLEELDDAIRADGGDCTIVPMDLRQLDGIDQLGAAIHERWGRLDGLLSNAGLLGEMSPIPHIDPKKWDETFLVNVHANYRLIRSMDPLMRASEAARAVFVSSSSAQSRRAYWGVYAASKSALDALVQSYAQEIEQTNIKVNLVYPGAVRTQMRAKAAPGEDPDILPSPADIAPRFVPLLSPQSMRHGEIINLK